MMMDSSPKRLLVFIRKAHNKGYTDKNGRYVAPFEDSRSASTQRSKPSPDEFVEAPGGGKDFGEITLDVARAIGRQPGKIRLQIGKHWDTNKGFGLDHIRSSHPEIKDIPAFIAEISKSFNKIWKTKKGKLLLVRQVDYQGTGKIAVIELRPHDNGDFYSVITAFFSRNPKGETLLWDATHSHPADSGTQPALHPTPAHKTGQEEKSAKQKEGKASITNPKDRLNKSLMLFFRRAGDNFRPASPHRRVPRR
jgi:hypothetical protein